MKLNLDNLKKEIERKKTNIEDTNNKLGFNNNLQGNKRRFLNGLIEARNNMISNEETEHLRKVNNVVDSTLPIESIKKHLDVSVKTQHRSMISENERDFDNRQIYDNVKDAFKRGRGDMSQQGILDSIESFNQTSTLSQTQQPFKEISQNTLNDGNINQLVKMYIENGISDEIKNTVVDMFFFDKIRKALVENEDVIRDIVIDVIRSLKRKK